MISDTIQQRRIRSAIIEALPSDTSPHGKIPERRHVYVPPPHVKALRLERSLVIGGRGVGKTFWSSALRDATIRRMIGSEVPDLSETDVFSGYGETPNVGAYPDPGTMERLLGDGNAPYHVWRAVVGRWIAGVLSEAIPRGSWVETVAWVKGDPERLARLLQDADAHFEREEKHALIVFDAIDRSSHRWEAMDQIVRDLLRVVLTLKPYRRLHGKVFLREDQFADRPVTDFPDASKLLATRVELSWGLLDLHGLLWQYLCNAPGEHGTMLRKVYETCIRSTPQPREPSLWNRRDLTHSSLWEEDGLWQLNEWVKRDEEPQRALFIELAGKWMGRDRRRGIPYTWTVGHLADARGRTSPRSFLAAIRAAAENSQERHPSHPYPLHYESIKRGVQKASEIRVWELAEDYPWVTTVMKPLAGLSVPCEFEVIKERWQKEISLQSMTYERLPPKHLEEGWGGLRKDLESLGIFATMKDGRINMPDLYRVGFGLGRRGGVRPISKRSVRGGT